MKYSLPMRFLIAFAMTMVVSLSGCNPEDAALQETCSRQCEAYFKTAFGDRVFDNKERAGSVSYKCHFNKKMSQCFMLLDENGYERSKDKLYTKKTLLTPADQKKIGYFYNIGTATVCDVLGKECQSENEWSDLVKHYMNE